MKWTLPILFALLPVFAHAQDVSGPATAVDGDSLDLSGIRVRLHGIDAPEARQVCNRSGQPWACGAEAAAKLAELVKADDVHCAQREIDDYGRIVAHCTAGETDIAQAMIDAGLAVALRDFTDKYVEGEERARNTRRGIWASDFQRPSDYRAENPVPRPKKRQSAVVERPSYARPPLSGVYYRGCADARAAGAAPLYRGQPGYRPEMDGDGDGIACEPYRGR